MDTNRPKRHTAPEFRVIRQNEANAKFFVASEFTNAPVSSGTPSTSAAASLTVNTSAQTTWF